MSDLMLHGVLNMPPNLWCDSPIDIAQRHSHYKEASQRIEQLERELTEAREDAANQRRLADMALAHRDVIIAERDTLEEALELFLSRVRYTSVFMNGNPTGGTFDYRSHGFDAEVELAHKALAAVKGGNHATLQG